MKRSFDSSLLKLIRHQNLGEDIFYFLLIFLLSVSERESIKYLKMYEPLIALLGDVHKPENKLFK